MSDLFGNLERQHTAHTERVGGSRAKTAATERAKRQFGSYVAKATGVNDLEARLAFAQGDILTAVREACAEHGYEGHDNVQEVLTQVMANLRALAFSSHEEMDEAAEEAAERDGEPECDCGNCPECNARKSSVKVADGATPPTGDTYTTERVDVAKDTLPETNKSDSAGLAHIDVPSARNPSEMQSISPTDSIEKRKDKDHAESGVSERIDADKPIGSEAVGDRTKTFTTPEGQASAVTSKWKVEGEQEA